MGHLLKFKTENEDLGFIDSFKYLTCNLLIATNYKKYYEYNWLLSFAKF